MTAPISPTSRTRITALEHHFSPLSILITESVGFASPIVSDSATLTQTLAEASPRDDLESLSYMLVYFLRGTLPWRKLKAATVAGTWNLIRDAKLAAGPELLAGLPREFSMLHEYARALEFGDTPDYMGLRATLRELGARVGAKYPASIDEVGVADQWGVFDWDIGRTGTERRGRVCEACRRREEASWATTRE